MTSSKQMILYRGIIALGFLLVSLVSVLVRTHEQSETSISFLDVGQGDAILIQTPGNKQVLIDAGPKDVVIKKLHEVMPSGDKTIDMIVITNPDADHISGFTQVLDEYHVDTALVPNTRNATSTYKNVMKKISDNHVRTLVAYKDMQFILHKGTTPSDDTVLSILFPDQVVKNWERNDGSIVSRLVHGNTSVMLMGDATSETEKIIIDNMMRKSPGMTSFHELESTILKLGHHGSRTSSSEAWLDVVKPRIAIVSAGKDNTYGHPHQEVIDRLLDRGIRIRETSKEGTMTYVSTADEWIEK